MIFLK